MPDSRTVLPTPRLLDDLFTHVSFALGGEAGSCLLERQQVV